MMPDEFMGILRRIELGLPLYTDWELQRAIAFNDAFDRALAEVERDTETGLDDATVQI